MKKIRVGSLNPTKVEAVHEILGKEYKVEAYSAPSLVSAQPLSDEETMEGAINRAKGCLQKDVFFSIGLEGGVTETKLGLMLCNWGALVDNTGKIIVASGAKILVPDEIAKQIRIGSELGQVMAEYTKNNNISKAEGAIGVFTSGQMKRKDMFLHIVHLLAGQYQFICKR